MNSSPPDNTDRAETRPVSAHLDRAFSKLWGAESADHAAAILLHEVMDAVREALATSPQGDQAEIWRAVLHLEDEHGAAGVLVVEGDRNPGRIGSPRGGVDPATSRMASRAVRESGRPALLDVTSRRLELAGGQILRLDPQQVRAQTVMRLERAQVTHLLAMPLRRADRRSLGLVSVEIRHGRGAGQRLGLLERAEAEIQPVLDLGGLLLTQLPRAPAKAEGARPAMGGALARRFDLVATMIEQGDPALLLGPTGVGKAWLAEQVLRSLLPEGTIDVLEAAPLTPDTLTGALASRDGLVIRHVEALAPPLQRLLARWMATRNQGSCVVLMTSRHQMFNMKQSSPLRAELWDQLRDHTVRVPSLSERSDELEELARAVLASRALERHTAPAQLSPAALDELRKERFTNGVTGLRDLVLRALIEAVARQGREGRSGAVEIDGVDVAFAREQIRPQAAGGVLEELQPVFQRLAERAPAAGLTLRDLEGLAGGVVAAALALDQDTFLAARRLGYTGERKGGNHLKGLRAARDRLEALCERLGEPAPEALRLLDRGRGEGER